MARNLPLPVELTTHIFREISNDKTTLKSCALVCRTWMPISRSFLFHHLNLSQKSIASLLKLCDNPLETFTSANIQSMYYRKKWYHDEPQVDLNGLLTWWSLDTKRNVCTIFRRVKTLELNGIDWNNMSTVAKQRLLKGLQSVTHLSLTSATFGSDHAFIALVNSFPALKGLKIEGFSESLLSNLPSATKGGHNRERLRVDLQKLSVKMIGDHGFIQSLIPCRSLRSFHAFDFDMSDEVWETIGHLLVSAGDSLEEFSWSSRKMDSEDSELDPDLDANFCKYIDLTKNPNLKHLEFDFLNMANEVPFLKRFAKAANRGSRVEIITIHWFSGSDETDWAAFDKLMQQPAFQSVRKLRLLVTENCDDDLGPAPSVTPDEGSDAQEMIEERLQEVEESFEGQLPLCRKRGIIEIGPSWCEVMLTHTGYLYS